MAQYQSTTLRVLTHFVADTGEVRGAAEEDGLSQQNFLLGSDWQVEVTQLVKDSLRLEDRKVAQLLEGQVLIGLSAGTTKLQVVCVCVLPVCFGSLIISLSYSVGRHAHVHVSRFLFGVAGLFCPKRVVTHLSL